MLEACALLSDLEILEDGDESEIGERGVSRYKSVHGRYLTCFFAGQPVGWPESSRYASALPLLPGRIIDFGSAVSLARAVYSRASVIFLDDVLSAGKQQRGASKRYDTD